MDAVRANHDVGVDRTAIGKARYGRAVVAFDRNAACAEPDLGGLERCRQNIEQVGTMHRQIRRAEFLPEITTFGARNISPALPASNIQEICLCGDCLSLFLKIERTQRFHCVRCEIEAGADLAQSARLLTHYGFGAAPLE